MLAFDSHEKKVLALVLAFAMAFTMMATAGAAYTDQADIQATEAVDVLNALGVMTGDPNGSFRPNDTITRAEACRMIYTIRSGGNDDASAYAGMQTTFTDVPADAWYAGYVKHCQSVGIVSGKSSTIFDPNSNVTGVELALMCLRVMGYDPAKADIGGSTWSTKTIGYAPEAGILDDVNTSITADCPRQWAAQIMYNMIDASTVRWSNDSESYTDVGTNNQPNETVGYKYMALKKVVGVMDSFVQPDGKNTYNLTVTNVDTDKSSANPQTSFNSIDKDYSSLKNQKVKVLYKKADEVYGVFALADENTVLTGLLGNFSDDGTKLKFDGTKYTVGTAYTDTDTPSTSDAAIYDARNLVKVDGTAVAQTASSTNYNRNDMVAYVKNVSGIQKAYDASAISNTNTNQINLLNIEGFAFGQVTYVGSDYINVSYKEGSNNTYSLPSKLEADDTTWYDGVAKDDYVAVTKGTNTVDGNYGVTKLDTVTGKITATKNSVGDDDYQITIDGNVYEMAMSAPANASDLKLNATVTIVVKGGYCLYVDNANAGATDIALMTELYKVGNNWSATLIKADGTKETVALKKNEGLDGTNPSAGFDGATSAGGSKLVSYTKSGDEYKLKTISASEKAGYDAYDAQTTNKVKSKQLDKGSVKAIDENAIVFVRYKTDKFTVIDGKTLRDWKDTVTFDTQVLANASNGVNYAKVIYADLKNDSMAGGSNVNYAYVFSASTGTDADETTYHVYQAWNGTETVELWTEDTDTVARGNVIEYSIDGDINGKTLIGIDGIYGAASTSGINYAWTSKGVVLNGEYGEDLNGTAYYAAATGSVNRLTEKTATVAQTPVTFDKDDDAIILIVDTAADDASGTGIAAASATNLKDFARMENSDYMMNAVLYTGANDKNIMVIDSTGKLDNTVFGLSNAADNSKDDDADVANAVAALTNGQDCSATTSPLALTADGSALTGSAQNEVVYSNALNTQSGITYAVVIATGVQGHNAPATAPDVAATLDNGRIKITENTNDLTAGTHKIGVKITVSKNSSQTEIYALVTIAAAE
ncbi:MAG: S-layer homology domain-containing protein [Butyricicoccus sp.]|nr:S-layer homology domain-containing protein [Butyricicoccus sp.]